MNYIYNPAKGLLLAIIPFYYEEGTAHKIFYEDGTNEVSTNRFSYIMNQYLKYWIPDLANLVSRSNNTGTKPMAISLNHTLIPLRARKPRLEGDKAYGLFWHERIQYSDNISREQVETLFCGGLEFEVFCSYSLLHQKRKKAKELQRMWKKRNGYLDEKNGLFKDLYTGLNIAHMAYEKIQGAEFSAIESDSSSS